MDWVFEKLQGIVFDVLEPDIRQGQIIPEAKFVDDLGADSLDRIAMMMNIEDLFGIEIPDEDLKVLETVGQAADYISQRLARVNLEMNFHISP